MGTLDVWYQAVDAEALAWAHWTCARELGGGMWRGRVLHRCERMEKEARACAVTGVRNNRCKRGHTHVHIVHW